MEVEGAKVLVHNQYSQYQRLQIKSMGKIIIISECELDSTYIINCKTSEVT